MRRVDPGTGTGTGTDRAAVVRRLARGMATRVLSFPLTSFREDGSLDPDGCRAHVAERLAAGPGALFPARGTGEFISLDEDEHRRVVTIAVEETAGRVPVLAGTPAGSCRATCTCPSSNCATASPDTGCPS